MRRIVRSLRRLTLMLSVGAAVASLSMTTRADEIARLLNSDREAEIATLARTYFPSDATAAPGKRLFRLTRDQIDATVRALLPSYVTTSVKSVVARDPLQTNYEYAELLGVNPSNVGALTGWFAEIAARVRQNPAAAIDCPAATPDPACLDTKARSFVIRAFRGDIGDDKIKTFVKFYTDGVASVGLAQATGDLVEVVLNSPAFLFRGEIDVTRTSRLTPAQLLQAVTYTIADAPPDKVGLKAETASQYLKTGAEAAATINTIVASNDAREKLVRFFQAWLEIKDPAEFTISAATFPDFTPALATAMVKETDQFLRAELSKSAPKLKDITQATGSFVSKALEQVYETRAGDANKPISLDTAKRLGIFSQAAVLASHSGPTNTRPIKRGVFWARKVLCMELEPPPQDLHAKLYDLDGVTERQRIEQSTKGAACAGCHKIINPLGFFQESWDALGRYRTTDNAHPVDASVMINFLDEEPSKAKSGVEALKTFTNSTKFKQCFVRQLFRYYMGRNEEAADDPLLRRMLITLARDDEQDILKQVFLLSSSDRVVRRQ